MSTPVKSTLMDAIEAALNAITLIKEVKDGQAIPTDEEVKSYPWACFFDELETNEDRNRTATKSFDLIVQVWVQEKAGTTLAKQLNIMDAELERELLNDAAVLDASRGIRHTSSDKLYVDDEVRAILQAVYRVSYAHAWKDPYDPARGV